MPWSSRTPSPIPWFSMLSMWSVRGRGDAGCPYAGALPTLPLGARGSGGTEVLARVCGPAGTGVLARVCGCGGLGARGSWHVSAALRAGGSWHVSAAVQPGPWGHGGPGTCVRLWRHAPGNTGRLLSRTVRHGCPGSCLWLCSQATGKKVPTFFLALSSAVREKKFGPFSGASLLSVFSPQEQQQRQQSRSVRSAWCRCRGLRRRRRRRRRPCSGQRGLESQARAL